MAGSQGKKRDISPFNRAKAAKKYFYLDGVLYRTVRQDRPNDLLRAWCFEEKRLVDFVLSDVKRMMQQAYTTAEVCVFLNRSKVNLIKHLLGGAINPPYKIYERDTTDKPDHHPKIGFYKWSEDDVMAMHEYFLGVGMGRPRADGTMSAPYPLPTRMELMAMMKQNKMFYILDNDGAFVPVFDQPDWT